MCEKLIKQKEEIPMGYNENLATENYVQKEIEKTKIITSAEGATIAVHDSDDAKLRGLKVFGRTEQYTNGYQLFDVNDLSGETDRNSNTKLAINDDGSFTIVNSNNQNVKFDYFKYIPLQTRCKAGKNLSLKVYGTTADVHLHFSDYEDIGIEDAFVTNVEGSQNSFMLTQSILDNTAFVYVSITGTMNASSSETIKIMLYQDGDGTWEQFTGGKPGPTTEFPCKLVSVGDDGSVDVNVHGYQLFDASIVKTNSNGGVTVTNNGDGSFTITGSGSLTETFSSMVQLDHSTTVRLLKTGTIKLTIEQNTFPAFCAYICDEKGTAIVRLNNSIQGATTSNSITDELLNTEGLYLRVGFYGTAASGSTITPCTIKPMLYQDGDGTYEPFKPIQTLNIPTPNGLPAVPVSSNGNYTDASGQQWVCDEIDFARGVYIKRVEEYCYKSGDTIPYIATAKILNGYDVFHFNLYIKGLNGNRGTTSVKSNALMSLDARFNPYSVSVQPNVEYVYLSVKASDLGIAYGDGKTTDELREVARNWLTSTFTDDNPLIIKYLLLEPTETPLSEEEINAYKALHTHYPHTSIHNSENAHMVVDYVADTKNYVDNQIKKEVAELTAAILTQ
jgi:hypothetical protein